MNNIITKEAIAHHYEELLKAGNFIYDKLDTPGCPSSNEWMHTVNAIDEARIFLRVIKDAL